MVFCGRLLMVWFAQLMTNSWVALQFFRQYGFAESSRWIFEQRNGLAASDVQPRRQWDPPILDCRCATMAAGLCAGRDGRGRVSRSEQTKTSHYRFPHAVETTGSGSAN